MDHLNIVNCPCYCSLGNGVDHHPDQPRWQRNIAQQCANLNISHFRIWDIQRTNQNVHNFLFKSTNKPSQDSSEEIVKTLLTQEEKSVNCAACICRFANIQTTYLCTRDNLVQEHNRLSTVYKQITQPHLYRMGYQTQLWSGPMRAHVT